MNEPWLTELRLSGTPMNPTELDQLYNHAEYCIRAKTAWTAKQRVRARCSLLDWHAKRSDLMMWA